MYGSGDIAVATPGPDASRGSLLRQSLEVARGQQGEGAEPARRSVSVGCGSSRQRHRRVASSQRFTVRFTEGFDTVDLQRPRRAGRVGSKAAVLMSSPHASRPLGPPRPAPNGPGRSSGGGPRACCRHCARSSCARSQRSRVHVESQLRNGLAFATSGLAQPCSARSTKRVSAAAACWAWRRL